MAWIYIFNIFNLFRFSVYSQTVFSVLENILNKIEPLNNVYKISLWVNFLFS